MADWVYIFCLLLPCLLVLSYSIPRILVPFIVKRAHTWGAIDEPNERKAHKNPTPRLGGISLMPTVWLSCSTILILGNSTRFAESFGEIQGVVTGLFIGSLGVFFLGVLDDIRSLSASRKLVVQIFAALFAVHFLPIPQTVLGIGADPMLVKLFYLGWIVFLMNSVNLLDGVDGLTSTLMILFLGVLGLMALLRQDYGWFLLVAPLGLSVYSFLRFNWSPAKIFLGDSGSLLLGFFVAYLSIVFGMTHGTGSTNGVEAMDWNLGISISLTVVWLSDTILAIIRRYLKRRPRIHVALRRSKRKYFALQAQAVKGVVRPDKAHIHHRLLALGMNSQQVVLSLFVFGAMTMTFSILLLAPRSELVQASLIDASLLEGPVALTVFSLALFLSLMAWYTISRSLDRTEKAEDRTTTNSDHAAAA